MSCHAELPPMFLKKGDQVAIMPHKSAPLNEVIEIAEVAYVGPELTRLVGGREYFTDSGNALDGKNFIVPATDEHRQAIASRKS